MVVTFLRHGSNIWLALGLAALIGGFIAGLFPFSLLWVVIGALTFYVSEYGFHRFSFHAEPSRFAFVRKLQHRLHYDHHAEPDRLDLLFLPVWFLVPNLAITALGFAIIFGWADGRAGNVRRDAGDLPLRMGALRRPYPVSAAHADRTLGEAVSPASPLHQREILVRRFQSVDGFRRPHLPWLRATWSAAARRASFTASAARAGDLISLR